MSKTSAGIMIYRINDSDTLFGRESRLEVFLVHPGGPFFKNKNDGFWTIPKGELAENEESITCAIRELEEETGYKITYPEKLLNLGEVIQKSGKKVIGLGYKLNIDEIIKANSNQVEIEFPPKSGKKILIPEVDKGDFFNLEEAKKKINAAQAEFIERLVKLIK